MENEKQGLILKKFLVHVNCFSFFFFWLRKLKRDARNMFENMISNMIFLLKLVVFGENMDYKEANSFFDGNQYGNSLLFHF